MTPAEFEKTFNLPFAEAEEFFLSKLNLPSKKWDDYMGEIHAKTFMSAGAYNADLLADLRRIVDKSITDGTSLVDFRKQFADLVKKRGWALNSRHDDPNSPDAVAWRADLIWRTNIATAYQAGRWQQFTDGTTEYLRYKHADGVMNPRPQHLAWNGLVLPIKHAFWASHYPPNGFGCHCRAFHVDSTELDKWTKQGKTEPPPGWDKPDKDGNIPGIDKGWDYNVGMAGNKRIQDIIKDKMDKWPPDIAQSFRDAMARQGVDLGGKAGGTAPAQAPAPVAQEPLDINKEISRLLDKSDPDTNSYRHGIAYQQPQDSLFTTRDGGKEVHPYSNIASKDADETQAIIGTFKELQAESKRFGIPGIRQVRNTKKTDTAGTMADGVLSLKTGRPIITIAPTTNHSASSTILNKHPVVATMWHEMGHHIHMQLDRVSKTGAPLAAEFKAFRLTLARSKKGPVIYPTAYSKDTSEEYFAETYAMIKTGRSSLVDSRVHEWMKQKGIV